MMNVILISRSARGYHRRSIDAPHQFILLGLGALLVVTAVGAGGYALGRWQQDQHHVSVWQGRLSAQKAQLRDIRAKSQREVNALTARLADLQSRVTRLDALGRKLIKASDIDASEFNFDSSPGVGGPEPAAGSETSYSLDDLSSEIDQLDATLTDRQRQLSVLDGVLDNRQIRAATIPAGRPIHGGWISSVFGYRKDPFTGKRAFHPGIDFAGRKGQPVYAVAAGVVTFAGKYWGYGNLVEITHGHGYQTLYGHNSKIEVKEGDIVRRGEEIAKMGSTGRSTGPHSHLEVRKNGKAINPMKFVQAER